MCGGELRSGGPGRPSRYCSAACRQRAYRARQAGVTEPQNDATAADPGSRADPDRERSVPHLTARELLAWRGMLEVQSRLLPMLDEDLRRQARLNVNEFDVLYQLWIAPGRRRRMKDLASAVLVTPSGITRMVDRLEDRGLVRRVNSRGRQAVEAVLTDGGDRLLRRAMDVHFAGVRRLFIAHLSETEVDRLVSLWSRLGHAGHPAASR
ncbi:MarR family winged helix-turn-helix transcriptional regulator [Actinoallomurus rhizosphaericola]|uniref:MarR family winged helix-turn-helix transcriptional regulator n=1 Tax=Actinoallomurus rhizosphaericola TaxID=2952536 RepID=UPI002092E7E7|nr:MarR family transcriptional regulator [Actinoallomurus rhizosphaericola]MCO5998978.1 MarR family transcriptional regulator [Actinoallomurus rhizosphaericola]